MPGCQGICGRRRSTSYTTWAGSCHRVAACRQSSRLHDLQYLSYPAYFSAAKRRYLAMTQGRSLKRAEVVTAVSDFTRTQAIEAFDLDPPRSSSCRRSFDRCLRCPTTDVQSCCAELGVRRAVHPVSRGDLPAQESRDVARGIRDGRRRLRTSRWYSPEPSVQAPGDRRTRRGPRSADLVARLGIDEHVQTAWVRDRRNSSPPSTPVPRCSHFPPVSRVSAFRSLRRWLPGVRWSRPTRPHCRPWSVTLACWSTPTTGRVGLAR